METSVPLPVARPHVRQTEWRCVSVLPELHAGWSAGGPDSGPAPPPDLEFGEDPGNAPSARRGPRRRSGYLFALLHHNSAPGPGDGQPGASWADSTAIAAGRGEN